MFLKGYVVWPGLCLRGYLVWTVCMELRLWNPAKYLCWNYNKVLTLTTLKLNREAWLRKQFSTGCWLTLDGSNVKHTSRRCQTCLRVTDVHGVYVQRGTGFPQCLCCVWTADRPDLAAPPGILCVCRGHMHHAPHVGVCASGGWIGEAGCWGFCFSLMHYYAATQN